MTKQGYKLTTLGLIALVVINSVITHDRIDLESTISCMLIQGPHAQLARTLKQCRPTVLKILITDSILKSDTNYRHDTLSPYRRIDICRTGNVTMVTAA